MHAYTNQQINNNLKINGIPDASVTIARKLSNDPYEAYSSTMP